MKRLVLNSAILLAVTVGFSHAFAANTFICKKESGTDVMATLQRSGQDKMGHPTFNVTLHPEISTSYVAIDHEKLSLRVPQLDPQKTASGLKNQDSSTERLSSSNGNWGVEVGGPAGFLDLQKGAKTRLEFRAEYNDIGQESVRNVLNCLVVD